MQDIFSAKLARSPYAAKETRSLPAANVLQAIQEGRVSSRGNHPADAFGLREEPKFHNDLRLIKAEIPNGANARKIGIVTKDRHQISLLVDTRDGWDRSGKSPAIGNIAPLPE